MPDHSESLRLMQAAQDGQASAVNALLDHHRAPLRAMVRARLDRALARRVDASDIVQDVLLEASQRLPEYFRDPRMPFPLWLRQMAQDRIIDTHRRHRVAARRSLDREQPLVAYGDQSSIQLAAQLRDLQLTPAAATIRRELERRFLAALEDLPEEDREIIVLRHFEHLSNSEAAEALGLTPPAAGMRHLRAVRRLRAILGEAPSQNSPS